LYRCWTWKNSHDVQQFKIRKLLRLESW
jgi:hypothetical protein